VRGLGRVSVVEALAEAERLNASLDQIVAVARHDWSMDLRTSLSNLRSRPTAPMRPTAIPTAAGQITSTGESVHAVMVSPSHASEPSRCPSLSQAIDRYEHEQWAAGRWKAGKAGRAAVAELQKFLAFVGDLAVDTISRDVVRAYRDHRGEALRPSTLNIKVMSRLHSLFGYCREEGWIGKLPTSGLRVRDGLSAREKRRPFTLDELREVFGPKWRVACDEDDHRFHCGRLLLATGARAEEIAQLRIEDVRVLSGGSRIALRITDEHPDQHLKNLSSRRVVPLHSAAVPGFLAYFRSIKERGHEWVFPRWRRTRTQPRSSPLVVRFGAYLRKQVGIEDRRVVLHSLRHTMKHLLQEQGAPLSSPPTGGPGHPRTRRGVFEPD